MDISNPVMHIPAINVPTVVESIVDHFEELILEGVLSPGAQLPSERKLAQFLGVSRTSVRMALAQLDAKGLVTVDRRAIHICGIFDSLMGEQLDQMFLSSPNDLDAMWRVLIRPVTELAAKNRTQHDINHLSNTIRTIKSSIQNGNRKSCSIHIRVFFNGLTAATYNFLFFQIANIYNDILSPGFDILADDLIDQPKKETGFVTALQALIGAIEDQDPSAALLLGNTIVDMIKMPTLDALKANAEQRQQRRQEKSRDQTLYEIQNYIDEKGLKPGDHLPDASNLAKHLKVATTAVKGALSKLEAIGAIKPDSYEYVMIERIDSLENPLIKLVRSRPTTIAAVFEFRMALEENIAFLAATRQSTESLDDLDNAFDCMVESLSEGADQYALHDIDFHIAISSLCGKTAMGATVTALIALFRSVTSQWLLLHQQKRGDLNAIHEQHQQIYKAIVKGDGDRGRKAMRNHLEYVIQHDRLFREIDRRTRISNLRQQIASDHV